MLPLRNWSTNARSARNPSQCSSGGSTYIPWSQLYINFVGPFPGAEFLHPGGFLHQVTGSCPSLCHDISSCCKGPLENFCHSRPARHEHVQQRDTMHLSRIQGVHRQILDLPYQVGSPPPSHNGQSECMVKTTKETLARLIHGNWDY